MVGTRRNLRGGRPSKRGRVAGARVAFKAGPKRGLRGITRRTPGTRGLARVQRYPKNLLAKQRYTSVNGNMTNSVCRAISRRPSKKVLAMERVGASNIYTDQYTLRVDEQYGFQGVTSYGFLTQAQLAKLVTLPVNMAGVSLNMPYRYVLESLIGNVTISNASTAPVELEIYDIVCKRDVPYQLRIAQNANTWDSPGYPDGMWAYGSYAANNTINTGGRAPSANIASSPFDSRLFVDYYRVVKRTQVLLTQGGAHRHGVFCKLNQIMDSNMFNQVANPSANPSLATAGMLGWKGTTNFVMVVQKGLPISDNTAATSVTTAETHIDVVQDWRIKWTYVVDNSYATYNADSLTSPASGSIVNIGSGLVEPVAATI